jgi:AcrR family transcriptional regulator
VIVEAVASAGPRRARPLSVEDRQSSIIDAVIPLLLEYGKDVTSRQIAEAAGIAEGTIFRAFGDKESLIAAAVKRYLDPLPLRTALLSISTDLPLHDKLHNVFRLLEDRFRGVIRMMSAVGMQAPPPSREVRQDFAEIIGNLLAEHADELRIAPERVAQFARVVAFASAIPAFGDSTPFTFDELVDLFEHGVVRAASPLRKKN